MSPRCRHRAAFAHATSKRLIFRGGVVSAGGNLIKQRVARPGGGRSGGTRTVIAWRASQRSVFLYGFAKSERDNIDDRELDDLRKLASHYLGYTDEQIAAAVHERELREVICDDQQEG
jgi:hypothetical protein